MKKVNIYKALLAVSAVLLFSGCFDNEPKEREYFIKFLNTHYTEQAGAGVADLYDFVEKDMGRYAEHHKVLTDYHDEIEKILRARVLSLEAVFIKQLDYDDIPAALASLEEAKAEIPRLLADNEEIYKKSLSRKNSLKMAEDLKPVYEGAFDKVVTRNYEAVKKVYDHTLIDLFDARIELLKFVQAHKGRIKIKGGRLEVADRALHAELKPLLDDANAKARIEQEKRREIKTSIRQK